MTEKIVDCNKTNIKVVTYLLKGLQRNEMYKIWNLCKFAQVSYFLHFWSYDKTYIKPSNLPT